jgi:uncharacterized protein YndB with AHSA1/START domain
MSIAPPATPHAPPRQPDRSGIDLLTYTCTIHIDAAPPTVWAIVSDLGRSAEWAGSDAIRTIEQTGNEPIGVGTRYRSSEKITMSYGAHTEITAFEPPALIRWRSKPVGERVPHHHWSFLLAPHDGGTLLIHELHARRATGIMGLVQRLGFLFTQPAKRIPPGMDRTLENVKKLAEG